MTGFATVSCFVLEKSTSLSVSGEAGQDCIGMNKESQLGGSSSSSILGSIPGTISFGLIGAALEGNFAAPTEAINLNLLIVSAVMFALSIALSRWFKTREIRTLNW